MKTAKSISAAMAATLLLAACGAGSPDDPPVPVSTAAVSARTLRATSEPRPPSEASPPSTVARAQSATAPTPPAATSAEGLWVGRTQTNRTLTGLILDDGTYYLIYSRPGNPASVGGLIQGIGTSNHGRFWSANARDFNLEGSGVLSATVSISYNARQAANGVITSAAGTPVSFDAAFGAAYDALPSLADLVGTFAGQVILPLGAQTVSVTVSASGTVTAAGPRGCRISGTVVPRAHGNVFDLALTAGGDSCFLPQQTLKGIAHFDRGLNRMYAAARNAAGSHGILFVGVKP